MMSMEAVLILKNALAHGANIIPMLQNVGRRGVIFLLHSTAYCLPLVARPHRNSVPQVRTAQLNRLVSQVCTILHNCLSPPSRTTIPDIFSVSPCCTTVPHLGTTAQSTPPTCRSGLNIFPAAPSRPLYPTPLSCSSMPHHCPLPPSRNTLLHFCPAPPSYSSVPHVRPTPISCSSDLYLHPEPTFCTSMQHFRLAPLHHTAHPHNCPGPPARTSILTFCHAPLSHTSAPQLLPAPLT